MNRFVRNARDRLRSGPLKSEWVPETGYGSEHEARVDVQRYITRYNSIRPHSYNDYWSPVAMEKLAA
ncbi:transposase [Pseudomonas chlororaphis subsp. aurantiaca]|nr:transposase [Pseudomonas chlororaphis subsp. aurantiaca]